MALSRRQRNIINPYADEDFNYPEGYDNTRNSWVIEGIHEIYLNFAEFPRNAQKILARGPVSETDLVGALGFITTNDLIAYSTLYPQNAQQNPAEVIAFELQEPSRIESNLALTSIAQRLNENNVSQFYTTSTTAEAQRPENQQNISEIPTDPSAENPEIPSDEAILKQITSQLTAIEYSQTPDRSRALRESLGFPSISLLDAPQETIMTAGTSPLLLQSDGIDMYNWQNNASAGQQSEVKYYNPFEEKYYFVKRTNSLDPWDYDNFSENATAIERINEAKRYGLTKILGVAGKLSQENLDFILNPEENNSLLEFRSFLSVRPASRWVYTVRISREAIKNLPASATPSTSYSEQASPYQKSKKLIAPDRPSPIRYSSFTVSMLEEKVIRLIYVLRQYRALMSMEGITPDMLSGFNLANEIESLETFVERMNVFYAYNNITILDPIKSYVEFVFSPAMQPIYIFSNGILYSEAMGKTIFTLPIPSDLNGGTTPASAENELNVFGGLSSQAWGFIYKSFDIESEISEKILADWPSWSEFIGSYTLPSVSINPTIISQKKKERSLKISPPPNIFSKINEIARPTPLQAEELFNKRELYQSVVVQAGSECNSGQATLFNDILMFANMINGKASVKTLVKTAVLRYKDDILRLKVVKANLSEENRELINFGATRGVRYLQNPDMQDQFYRDAEEALNSELSCLTGIIGEYVEDMILKPNGDPPLITRALRSPASQPSMTFRFRKTPTPNMWSAWSDLATKLLHQFLKQLFYGILRDVLKASLGCGPDQPNNASAGLKSAIKVFDYGMVDLNGYLEGIDTLEIAKNSGLSNKEYNREEDKLALSPPTKEQLTQLHSDVSDITTPDELKLLLQGSASIELVSLVEEMINSGPVDTNGLTREVVEGINQLQTSGGNIGSYSTSLSPNFTVEGPHLIDSSFTAGDIIKLSYIERQESLRPGDARYAMLGLNKTTIADYFSALGSAMDSGVLDVINSPPHVDQTSPEDAYCESLSPLSLDPVMSREQIQQQYDELIEAKIKQIDSLCGLSDLPILQLQLDSFLAALPDASWYDNILAWISQLSNLIADLMAKALFGDDETKAYEPRAASFNDTLMSKALAANRQGSQNREVSPVFSPWNVRGQVTTVPIGATMIPSPGFQPFEHPDAPYGFYDPAFNTHNGGIVFSWGPRSLDDRRETVRFWHTMDWLELGIPLIEVPIAEREWPVTREEEDEFLALEGEGEMERGGNSLRGLRDSMGNPGIRALDDANSRMIPTLTTPVQSKVNEVAYADNNYRIVVANPTTTRSLVERFYYSDIGRSRLPSFLKILLNPYFVSDKGNCVTTADENIALSALAGIQSRVITFFMNTGPLLTAYLGWSAPTTLNILSGYLFGKLAEELRSKNLYGPYLQAMEKVQVVYKDTDGEQTNKIQLDDGLNNTQILKAVIRQSIEKVLSRMPEQTAYQGHMNPLDPFATEISPTPWANYRSVADELRRNLATIPHLDDGEVQTLGNMDDLTWKQWNFLDDNGQFLVDTQWRSLSFYYYPIPILYGAYIVYMDKCIDLSQIYPRFALDSERRAAYADDQLLSAINPQYVPKFSAPYANLPYTFVSNGGDSATYWTPKQIRERLVFLESAIEATSLSIVQSSEWLEEDREQLRQQIDQIQETIRSQVIATDWPAEDDNRVVTAEAFYDREGYSIPEAFTFYYRRPHPMVDWEVGPSYLSQLAPSPTSFELVGPDRESPEIGRILPTSTPIRIIQLAFAAEQAARAAFANEYDADGEVHDLAEGQEAASLAIDSWMSEYITLLQPLVDVSKSYFTSKNAIERDAEMGEGDLMILRTRLQGYREERSALQFILGENNDE